MSTFTVTYAVGSTYDVESSLFENVQIEAADYDAATAEFHKQFPGNVIFSIDENP